MAKSLVTQTRNKYIVKTLGGDHEILAWDVEDAYRQVSRMIHRQYPVPLEGNTYWMPCRLYDGATGRLIEFWSEPIIWPGEIVAEYATSTYYLFVDGDSFANEYIAADRDEAVARGRALLRDIYGPNRSFETLRLAARIEDTVGSVIHEWTETLEPESPDCDAPIPELGDASAKILGGLLGLEVHEEDGHAWARPFSEESICLRCGTARTDEGYDPGRYAAAVGDMWRIAHPVRPES